MKPLKIPKSKKTKCVKVVCNNCDALVYDVCKATGKSIETCKHGDSHRFKILVHVSGTRGGKKTKTLKTRDLNEAIKESLDFEREIKLGLSQTPQPEEKKVIQPKEENKPVSILEVATRFVGYLNNENVPRHMQKERSQGHLKDAERAMKFLLISMKKHGHDIKTFRIEDLNDKVVGEVYTDLEDKGLGNRSHNKYFMFYRSFLNWYADEYQPVRNWFKRGERKKESYDPIAISQKEYEAVLNRISHENGIEKYETGTHKVRNFYRPWLKDGIRLGLETGRRREEIISLKWSDVSVSDSGIEYFTVEDFKVNRIMKLTGKNKEYIYIPITQTLREVLNDLGYQQNRNTDKYVLAPDTQTNRTRTMSEVLSRGFAHYFKQIGSDRELTFRSLRKAYITNLEVFKMGGNNINTLAITGHSGNEVKKKHYFDERVLAIAAQSFKVFPKEQERMEELNEIRTKNLAQRSMEVSL